MWLNTKYFWSNIFITKWNIIQKLILNKNRRAHLFRLRLHSITVPLKRVKLNKKLNCVNESTELCFFFNTVLEQHLTSICTVWLQLWAFRADNAKAELAVLSRMCAASIYGKEMTDSCSGNADNKREDAEEGGKGKGKGVRRRRRKEKAKKRKKGKKNNCRRCSRCAGALSRCTLSPWQQAGGREATTALTFVGSARLVPINLLCIKRHQSLC